MEIFGLCVWNGVVADDDDGDDGGAGSREMVHKSGWSCCESGGLIGVTYVGRISACCAAGLGTLRISKSIKSVHLLELFFLSF